MTHSFFDDIRKNIFERELEPEPFLSSSEEEDDVDDVDDVDAKDVINVKKRYKKDIVYTITVYGSGFSQDFDDEIDPKNVVGNKMKPIVLNIYKEENQFVLVCFMKPIFSVECGTYRTLVDARKAMGLAMKLSMKDKLLYKKCGCGEKLWYTPASRSFCGQCHTYTREKWRVDMT
jgi:hypothetical protein